VRRLAVDLKIECHWFLHDSVPIWSRMRHAAF
jgi:hypothetical protein